jgi:hypothetical protein
MWNRALYSAHQCLSYSNRVSNSTALRESNACEFKSLVDVATWDTRLLGYTPDKGGREVAAQSRRK